MDKKKLKFKNLGAFLEEDSSRYGAKLTESVNVKIYKCSYRKEWLYRFYDSKFDYSIDELNNHICDSFSTKKEVVKDLESSISESLNSGDDKEAFLNYVEAKGLNQIKSFKEFNIKKEFGYTRELKDIFKKK